MHCLGAHRGRDFDWSDPQLELALRPLPEENKDPKFRAIAWQSLLWAIWGKNSENGGSKAIKTAPKELKEKYQQVFA